MRYANLGPLCHILSIALERQKLLERIRKLYAMAQEADSSPHEAEIALRRCRSLMERFGVSESDLETPEFSSSKVGKGYRSTPAYVSVLGASVGLLHDCLCVDSGHIEFRGFSVDADVAPLTYDYLFDAMERSLKMRKASGEVAPGRSSSFDYRVGYAISVMQRCQAIDEERRRGSVEPADTASGSIKPDHALVIKKLELVREACSGDLARTRPRKVRYRDGEAHRAGTTDGHDVSLDQQLETEKNAQLSDV